MNETLTQTGPAPSGNGGTPLIDDIAEERERLGWRTLRPPSPRALIFGSFYGAVAGVLIAWDIVVLLRFGRAARDRIRNRR